MASTEEPILSRLDRLDAMLKHLEEIRGCNRSPKSSCASTPSSGTLTSNGGHTSVDSSPNSLEKHCRPIDAVMEETEVKGTLIDRLLLVETRVLKLEEEIMVEKKREEKRDHKKGLKQLVKSCVGGNSKAKD
ncbi:hypothetical protein HHK36_017770 [Tetracentron sinense]|uniref:Uncharacterized protein n=1 Tax=Tetracentron sinense TaxID=13715 RepID=A0A834Z3D5_TETSI|nr:hypothetical protein HHK36_017770 [Tetracentron sinense]